MPYSTNSSQLEHFLLSVIQKDLELNDRNFEKYIYIYKNIDLVS